MKRVQVVYSPIKGMNMKKAVMRMATGGRISTQWEDYPDSPSVPGYQDYGTMYSYPGKGLFHKVPDRNQGWEGFGNPANLLQNQPTPQSVSVRPMSQPVRGIKRDNPDNYYLQGEGSISDYSIDNVRSQYMKYGGMKKKVMIEGVPQLANGGWASQRGLGLYLPYPLSYDAKPYQQKDPEYRMKDTLPKEKDEYREGEMYDVDEYTAEKLRTLGYEFKIVK